MDRLDFLPPPQIESEPQTLQHHHSDGLGGISHLDQSSEVRILTPAEISTLASIFEQNNAPFPNPDLSFFVGSVAPDGHVSGFLVIQQAIHAEPMWVEPGNSTAFSRIVARAEEEISARATGFVDVFLHAPAGRISQLAAAAGMRVEPWVVMSKRIEGKWQPPAEAAAEETSTVEDSPAYEEDLPIEPEEKVTIQ